MSKNYKLVGDFETTAYANYLKDGFVRVWAFSLREIETNKNLCTGDNIDQFFEYLGNKNTTVYFHNLKFDGQFILYYLLTHGYVWTEKPQRAGEFSTLITDCGLFYSIEVIYKAKNKKYNKTKFLDSHKKLPLSADAIAKSFELDELKGSIDYTMYRGNDYIMTQDERHYVENDTAIISQALKVQFDEGLKSMTLASDALKDFKGRLNNKAFNYLFPQLPHSVDADIRQSYRGGFVYCDPRFANKEYQNVISYDVNSLYPSVMYTANLPYGQPSYYEGKYKDDAKYPLYICCISAKFKLKDNHIPTLQLKHCSRFAPTDYITESGEESVQMVLTSVDFQLFKDHYNITYIDYICGWKFKASDIFFKGYIDYWGERKKTTTGGKRFLAKRMLNSLYGKFGTNDIKQQKRPYLSDDIVKYEMLEETIDKTIYTALACFVTAYARDKTIRTAQSVYPYFAYADTDSIHLVGTTPEHIEKLIDVHDKDLGKWGYEGLANRAKFIRCKTYIKEKNGSIYVTCAGMPARVKKDVTFDNFKVGQVFDGKLMPKNVKGGVVLLDKEFTLKG